MPQTIEITAAVEKVYDDGGVVFDCMCSVYQAPPGLEPIFRAALAAHRKVKFTHRRDRNIVTAELMPPTPSTPLMRAGLGKLDRTISGFSA